MMTDSDDASDDADAVAAPDRREPQHSLLTHYALEWGNSPLAGDGRVSRHRLGRHLEVRVGAVEERLPPLGQVLQDEAGRGRGGHAVQGAAARAPAILHIEAADRDRETGALAVVSRSARCLQRASTAAAAAAAAAQCC